MERESELSRPESKAGNVAAKSLAVGAVSSGALALGAFAVGAVCADRSQLDRF